MAAGCIGFKLCACAQNDSMLTLTVGVALLERCVPVSCHAATVGLWTAQPTACAHSCMLTRRRLVLTKHAVACSMSGDSCPQSVHKACRLHAHKAQWQRAHVQMRRQAGWLWAVNVLNPQPCIGVDVPLGDTTTAKDWVSRDCPCPQPAWLHSAHSVITRIASMKDRRLIAKTGQWMWTMWQ